MALGAKQGGKKPHKGGAAESMMSMSEAELSKMASKPKHKKGGGKHRV